ncbi:hypothetical protein BD626DRAFT_72171 [Schizophyllum amplum]|uniref:Uncharacterized protein n=1 Tax=Schizophyllum amplum TaxID=97359 RepID=A0A550CAC7_9AGAR|nr:hypothetical protein BD626DRAFT_72171 [Auriculariopsis ampla]
MSRNRDEMRGTLGKRISSLGRRFSMFSLTGATLEEEAARRPARVGAGDDGLSFGQRGDVHDGGVRVGMSSSAGLGLAPSSAAATAAVSATYQAGSRRRQEVSARTATNDESEGEWMVSTSDSERHLKRTSSMMRRLSSRFRAPAPVKEQVVDRDEHVVDRKEHVADNKEQVSNAEGSLEASKKQRRRFSLLPSSSSPWPSAAPPTTASPLHREAALRERGLMPPRELHVVQPHEQGLTTPHEHGLTPPMKDLSELERDYDATLPVLAAPGETTAARRIKEEWRARNGEQQAVPAQRPVPALRIVTSSSSDVGPALVDTSNEVDASSKTDACAVALPPSPMPCASPLPVPFLAAPRSDRISWEDEVGRSSPLAEFCASVDHARVSVDRGHARTTADDAHAVDDSQVDDLARTSPRSIPALDDDDKSSLELASPASSARSELASPAESEASATEAGEEHVRSREEGRSRGMGTPPAVFESPVEGSMILPPLLEEMVLPPLIEQDTTGGTGTGMRTRVVDADADAKRMKRRSAFSFGFGKGVTATQTPARELRRRSGTWDMQSAGRLPLAPTMHSVKSISTKMESIEDEETRRMTEVAFM